jgi:hypothetical protein
MPLRADARRRRVRPGRAHQELRVLRAGTASAAFAGGHAAAPRRDDAPRDVLLRLSWAHDIARISLAGRFLVVVQCGGPGGAGGAARSTQHLFKLHSSTSASSLVNVVRAHSEWLASRPFLHTTTTSRGDDADRRDDAPSPRQSRRASRPSAAYNSWDVVPDGDEGPREGDCLVAQQQQHERPPPLPPRSAAPGAVVAFNSGERAFTQQEPPSSATMLGWTSFEEPAPPVVWAISPPTPTSASLALGAAPSSVGSTSGSALAVRAPGAAPPARTSSGTVREQLLQRHSETLAQDAVLALLPPSSASPSWRQQQQAPPLALPAPLIEL